MKFSIDEIKGFDIVEYVDYVFNLPNRLHENIVSAKNAFERHVHARFVLFRYSLENGISDGFMKHYRRYETFIGRELKKREAEIEKYIDEAKYILISSGNIEAVSYSDKEILDKLLDIKFLSSVYGAEAYFKASLEVEREKMLTLERFDNNAIVNKMKELSETEFKHLSVLKDGRPCTGFFNIAKISIELAEELAMLTFYKELVCGEIDNVQQNGTLSMIERLTMLKGIGLFDLPYFSIDPRTAKVSEREQSKFLAKILECNEDNIRKAIRKVRK